MPAAFFTLSICLFHTRWVTCKFGVFPNNLKIAIFSKSSTHKFWGIKNYFLVGSEKEDAKFNNLMINYYTPARNKHWEIIWNDVELSPLIPILLLLYLSLEVSVFWYFLDVCLKITSLEVSFFVCLLVNYLPGSFLCPPAPRCWILVTTWLQVHLSHPSK